MSIKDIVKILTDSGIEPNEAAVEAKMLIEHFCNFSALDIVFGKKLDEKRLEIAFEKAKLRAKTRRPIQHIIGFADFMGEKFIVNEKVLIPRDETEFLVRKAIEIIQKNCFKTALDVGTGSGCIACIVAKYTDCQVIGLDISSDALMVALENATKLQLNNRAIFRKSDIFSNVKKDEKFDIILSNPPYIPKKERSNIQIEVSFDPQIALYTEDLKGLEFYEKIISASPEILNKGGYLIFEIGQNQSQDVTKLLKQQGFGEIETIKDLAQIERVVCAKY